MKSIFLDDDDETYGVNSEYENLIEMAKVFDDKNDDICLVVNPDRDRNNHQSIGYFKFLDSINYEKATKIARIKFNSPEYVIHKRGNDKRELWFLNSKERKKLMSYLNRKVKVVLNDTDIVTVSVFQKLILQHNYEYLTIDFEDTYNGKNKDGIKFDTEMPDYTKLRK